MEIPKKAILVIVLAVILVAGFQIFFKQKEITAVDGIERIKNSFDQNTLKFETLGSTEIPPKKELLSVEQNLKNFQAELAGYSETNDKKIVVSTLNIYISWTGLMEKSVVLNEKSDALSAETVSDITQACEKLPQLKEIVSIAEEIGIDAKNLNNQIDSFTSENKDIAEQLNVQDLVSDINYIEEQNASMKDSITILETAC